MAPTVEEVGFERVNSVHKQVPEFDADHLERKYANKGIDGADPTRLVAEIDGNDAGYLVAYDKLGDGSYYVWMAGVIPEYRRDGVMSALVGEIEDMVGEHGYDSVKIKTRNERRGMRHFLVDHGYDVCAFDPVGDLDRHEITHVKSINTRAEDE